LPFANVNNLRLYYRLEGAAWAPVLVLSHSIGTDHGMWAPQMADLLQHFQVLRYDTRGHGASDAPAGEYTIEQLGRDVLGLTDSLHIEKFAFCGLSMGGAIGQWLAINAPDGLTALILANTSPQFGPLAYWDTRRTTLLANGMASIVDLAMQRFFSSEAQGRDVLVGAATSVLSGTNPAGYAGCCSALRDVDHRGQLGRIQTPTLVIAGRLDGAVVPKGLQELTQRLPNATFVEYDRSGHFVYLDEPDRFVRDVTSFIAARAAPKVR